MTSKLEKPKPHQMLPKPNIKRKSGGQPGNLNAFKHGFYSRRFRTLELSDLSTVLTGNLTDEIALLRVIIRRVFELADTDAETLEDWQMALSTLGAAATRVAGMLRTQFMISGNKGGDDLTNLIIESIKNTGHKRGFF